MARMIPPMPRSFKLESKEGVIYSALQNLSDDYYVFHSFGMVYFKDKRIVEGEADFIIFNKNKGVIVVEAKAGQVRYENGQWLYGSGQLMKHDGPFNQAQLNKYKLMELIANRGNRFDISRKCLFMHAVCFPSISNAAISSRVFPSESPKDLIISKDDLNEIESAIVRIYNSSSNRFEHNPLNKTETEYMINNIFCPTFNLVPTVSHEHDIKEQKFNILLEEQKRLLDFLEEQKSAIISGQAGTGKTMIALEKANRHAANNEKVLFLCYNKKLQRYLEDNYKNSNIDFYTIDKFAIKYTKTPFYSFEILCNKLLLACEAPNSFEYDHIIIDEGQDFGKDNLEDQQVIEYLSLIMEERDGSLYIFYDKLQLVQGENIPEYIADADCKITLYKNCRNTYNIAKNSMSLLEKEPKLKDGAVTGELPECTIIEGVQNNFNEVSKMISNLLQSKIENIVILTAKTIESSSLNEYINNGYMKLNNTEVEFTTIRKFKGLESDAVIIVDIDKNTILENKLIYYVGASRAKFYLKSLINLNDDEIDELIEQLNIPRGRNKKKQLASFLNSYLVMQ
ncbi:NERD domain-containing protein [Mycoplasmatota bacterium]|nr:NERD domain-containing protein [Mycoplasmatota bacterium]